MKLNGYDDDEGYMLLSEDVTYASNVFGTYVIVII